MGPIKDVLRLPAVLLPVAAAIALFAASPSNCAAFWPFTEPYVAKVNGEVITSREFVDNINRLHTSKRVGKAIAEEGMSFAKQDYRKFLEELIDKKLMVMEAGRLGLDKEAAYINDIDIFTLNLFLDQLRKEEVDAKVIVSAEEVEDYRREELKKKEEEKKKKELKKEEAAKGKEFEKAEKKEEAAAEGEKEEAKKEEPKAAPHEKDSIAVRLRFQKMQEREKEFFASIRQGATVKIEEEILKDLSRDKTEFFGKPVAYADGEPVFGIEIIEDMKKGQEGDEAKKASLDKLILYKLLDREALSRREKYLESHDISDRLKRYSEERLIELFKKSAVLPSIKVDEKEILDYYEANKDRYREPDMAKLRVIMVASAEDADAVAQEIRKGADFAYLAKTRSMDSSRERGGDIGWVPVYLFPPDVQETFRTAKDGQIVGPFKFRDVNMVVEFGEFKKGAQIPVVDVKTEIDGAIGREKFETTFAGYLKQLRDSVPVEINEEEYNNVIGR